MAISSDHPGSTLPVLNFGDPAFIANPFPTYKKLLETDPVHHLPNGAWFLTRYADVATLLRDDKRLLKERDKSLANYPPGPFQTFASHTMMLMDGADHSRVRAAFNPFFTPQAITEWESCISKVVLEAIAQLKERAQFDFVSEFARPVSAGVIAEMFRLPREHREFLMRWGAGAVGALDPIAPPSAKAEAESAAREFTEYFDTLITERAANPLPDDMISQLAQVTTLSRNEIIHNLAFLVVAGLEIAAILMGSAVHLLFEFPHLYEQLRREPEQLDNAVEEFVRLAPPGHIVYRFAGDEMTVGGKTIPKDSYVMFCLAAANRDPEQFPNPDEPDLSRPARQNKHVAFALGSRFCIGAHLGRLETKLALRHIIEHFPRLTLVRPPVVRQAVVFHGFNEMIVAPG
jgi:pimeloyl-[acyl-carrier protein] synthase